MVSLFLQANGSGGGRWRSRDFGGEGLEGGGDEWMNIMKGLGVF